MAGSDEYNELIFKLGDLARERLGNKPNPPRSMERVLTAEETLVGKEDELKQINQAMDEEEAAYTEFNQAVDEEKAELEPLMDEFKKAIDAAEAKYKTSREKIASKENDLKHAKLSLQKEEEKIKEMEHRGEKSRAETARASLKNLRMDIMRRQRELREMSEEAEKIINPPDDDGPSNAVRARTRVKDLETQLVDREKLYNETLAELDSTAAEKEQEIAAARDYYDQAIFLLGEEAYQARVNDAALVPLYLKLDKAAS
jgi:DNA repair exonuclease SbcCD ATPase subunit